MKSENGNNSNDECTTKFTDVKTGEVMPVDKNLLIVEFGKPSKLLGGIEGFNNTTLTRYLRMKVWTLLQCALLAGGVLPNDDYTEVPEFAMGLQNKWLGEGDFQLREARRILIDLRGDAMPDEISPTDFFAWLKARPDPEFHALRWLSAIEELKSETITVESTTEIKEQPKETTEERQDCRLQACEKYGLVMPKSYLSRLPDGIAKVADIEGVKRQSFTQDVKAALKRRFPS